VTALLASCYAGQSAAGGVFEIDPGSGAVTQLDPFNSSGMTLAGDRLARLLRPELPSGNLDVGELLVYDERGVERYRRIDRMVAAHDILFLEGEYVVACTAANELAWLDQAGNPIRWWRAGGGSGDAWHLNSLTEHDGVLVASAFGRFDHPDGWRSHLGDGTGIVFETESGRDLLTGLNAPHHPRFVDGSLVVCNSFQNELLRADPTSGEISDRLALAGFTRGIAVAADVIYVGESGDRHADAPTGATVAILDRRDWRLLGRVPLPVGEVYELLLVPPALRDAVATGFRTTAERGVQAAQASLILRAGADPVRSPELDPQDCRVAIAAEPLTEISAGGLRSIAVSITNHGPMPLASAPPHPVSLSYRWHDESGRRVAEGPRSELPEPLGPGVARETVISVVAPDQEGSYYLRVSAVQEDVRWFDDVDDANRWECLVSVVPSDIVLRHLTPEDEPALTRLFADNDAPEVTDDFYAFPLDAATAHRLAHHSGADRYYGVWSGNRLAGLAMLRGWEEGYEIPTYGLLVDRGMHGQRIGVRATALALTEARSLGASVVRVNIDASNERSLRMCRRCGYVDVARDGARIRLECDLGRDDEHLCR
jgi:acetolactate synthase-1/2/3 large subunit